MHNMLLEKFKFSKNGHLNTKRPNTHSKKHDTNNKKISNNTSSCDYNNKDNVGDKDLIHDYMLSQLKPLLRQTPNYMFQDQRKLEQTDSRT